MAINLGPPTAANVPSRDSTLYKVMAMSGSTEILDIRAGPTEFDILQDIKKGLRPADGGEKRLPTLLLYDEAGLRLFEKITYLDEYYLTNAEIEVCLSLNILLLFTMTCIASIFMFYFYFISAEAVATTKHHRSKLRPQGAI